MYNNYRLATFVMSISICLVTAVSSVISLSVFSKTPQVFGLMPSFELSQWIKTSLQHFSGSLKCFPPMISTLEVSNPKNKPTFPSDQQL